MTNSTKSWLELVAESKRKQAELGMNSKGSDYFNWPRKFGRRSKAGSSTSKPTQSKLATEPRSTKPAKPTTST